MPEIFPCTNNHFINKSFISLNQTLIPPYALQSNTTDSGNSSFCRGSQKTRRLRCAKPLYSRIAGSRQSSSSQAFQTPHHATLWLQSGGFPEPLSKSIHLVPVFPSTQCPFIHEEPLLARQDGAEPQDSEAGCAGSSAPPPLPRAPLRPTRSQAPHAPRTPRTPRLTLFVPPFPPALGGWYRRECRGRWGRSGGSGTTGPQCPRVRRPGTGPPSGSRRRSPYTHASPWSPTDPTFTLSIAVGVAPKEVLHIRHCPARLPLPRLGAAPRLFLRHGTNETRQCRKDALKGCFRPVTWFPLQLEPTLVHCYYTSTQGTSPAF